MNTNTHVSTKTAAAILGVTDARVRQLLIAGQLRGFKLGTEWLVVRRSVDHRKFTLDTQLRKR